MTNRILPETLPALYVKYGVAPIEGAYVSVEPGTGQCCACGMGITFYDRLGEFFGCAKDVGLDTRYEAGYTAGFDEAAMGHIGDPQTEYPDKSDEWQLGYADGAAGWAAVKDLAVTR